MATMYEITEDFKTLMDMALDPDVDEEMLQDTLEGLTGEFHAKADGYAMVMAEVDGRIEAIKVQIKRLTEMKRSYESHIESMKKRLMSSMVETGETKFKTDFFSFGIQKNPPAAVIDLEEAVPFDFWTVPEPVVDKAKVKAFLKENPECEWAHLEQGESLRIR